MKDFFLLKKRCIDLRLFITETTFDTKLHNQTAQSVHSSDKGNPGSDTSCISKYSEKKRNKTTNMKQKDISKWLS